MRMRRAARAFTAARIAPAKRRCNPISACVKLGERKARLVFFQSVLFIEVVINMFLFSQCLLK